MSRRHPRVRTQIAATLRLEDSETLLVCPTRDVSTHGVFLDTAEEIEIGTGVALAVFDHVRGEVIEVVGRVARRVPPDPDGRGGGLGVALDDPPGEWQGMVERIHDLSGPRIDPARRLRVLVVGDDDRRRGALALYVRSGWDVRFASDLPDAIEALEGVEVHAVIAEHDLDDDRWPALLIEARRLRPAARRIVRSSLHGQPAPATDPDQDLVHRVVDLDAGLDALVDALTADF